MDGRDSRRNLFFRTIFLRYCEAIIGICDIQALPIRMCSSLLSDCLSVCLYFRTTGYEAAYERYQQL